jgi:hypothetical protein
LHPRPAKTPAAESLVLVSMMRVRKMRVRVCNRIMMMAVRMARTRLDREWVIMLMVRIMLVFVLVIEDLVSVLVLLAFREVQPDTAGHEQAGREKSDRYGFIE